MLSTQQAQTGNRVYGGTSQAPNRGQVSAAGAQGYIKRELRNQNRAGVLRRMGMDGKSDNRSTVAAQALSRKVKKKNHHGGNGNTGVVAPPPSGPGQVATDPNGNIVPNPPPAIQPPSIQVTPDGILQLPYDQSFGADQLAAINDANQQLLDLKAQSDQKALEFASNRRDADSAYNSLKQQTLNQNAAGGTAFSSKYGTGVSNNATAYANELKDLEYENAAFNQDKILKQSAIQSSLNQQLAALAQQYADSLNQGAGTLGYGIATPASGHIHKPKSKKGHKK